MFREHQLYNLFCLVAQDVLARAVLALGGLLFSFTLDDEGKVEQRALIFIAGLGGQVGNETLRHQFFVGAVGEHV